MCHHVHTPTPNGSKFASDVADVVLSVLLAGSVGSAALGPVSRGSISVDRGVGREIGTVGKATEGSTGRPLDGSKSDSARVIGTCCRVGDVGAFTELQGLSRNIEGIFGLAEEVDQGLVDPTVYEVGLAV